MKWIVYNALFAVVYVMMLPAFLLRMCRRGGYAARFNDRFGRYPTQTAARLAALRGKAIWIHAVSVGEVYVAGQMMREIRAREPDVRFVFSTTSSTGWREAEKIVTSDDVLIYNPLDFPLCVRRALHAITPRAVILTESEIWPNFIRACHARHIPLFLINARISDRSAPRYAKLSGWFGPVFRMFTRIYAQSDMDKARLIAAGAYDGQITVTGSFKFDVAHCNELKATEIRDYFHAAGWRDDARIVLLGGSTWPGEDAVLVRIYRALMDEIPTLHLALVPRHFEKADAVEATVRAAGLPCMRRSRGDVALDTTSARPVIIGDTTGELMGFYGCSDIVFVGKSLCEHGAQNMIEPCLCGAATLIGPYTENFRPVMADLLAADAIVQVSDEATLAETVARFARDAAARHALGQRASAAVDRRRGVAGRCATDLLTLMNSAQT